MPLRITGLGDEIATVAGLPWEIPLEEWPEDPTLTQKRGLSRQGRVLWPLLKRNLPW